MGQCWVRGWDFWVITRKGLRAWSPEFLRRRANYKWHKLALTLPASLLNTVLTHWILPQPCGLRAIIIPFQPWWKWGTERLNWWQMGSEPSPSCHRVYVWVTAFYCISQRDSTGDGDGAHKVLAQGLRDSLCTDGLEAGGYIALFYQETKQIWIQIQTWLSVSCVTLGKSLHISEL